MMIRLLDKAFDYYGLKEVPGIGNNPQIIEFFQEIGQTWAQDDETAWCSAFINYCAKLEGYDYTGELTAKSWLRIGVKIPVPVRGCIVVFWRDYPESWKGHVGLYITQRRDQVYVLGGNQDNRVVIKPYPINRLIGYYLLK